jgi:hypothetical protein
VFLYAFDLIELNGEEVSRRVPQGIHAPRKAGLLLNEPMDEPGDAVFLRFDTIPRAPSRSH